MKARKLRFSEPFLKATYLEDATNLKIKEKTIIVNVDSRNAINIASKPLNPWKSSIFANVTIPHARRIVSITVKPDFVSDKHYKYAATLRKKWANVYDLFRMARHKGLDFYRSEKEKVNDITLNFWFAATDTDCGLHKHAAGFKEVHTQVFGTGRMQKFHENRFSSIYQDVFMSPGYTHEPFYNGSGSYPWHQYYADTDCIWMAIESGKTV